MNAIIAVIVVGVIIGIMTWGGAIYWYRASPDPRKIEVPKRLAQISRGSVNPSEKTIEVKSFGLQLMGFLMVVWTILVMIVIPPSEERANMWGVGNVFIFLIASVFMTIWWQLYKRKNRDK